MSEAEKQRLIANIAAPLSLVSKEDIIERALAHFGTADPDYGQRLAHAVRELRAKRAESGAKATAGAPAHPGLK